MGLVGIVLVSHSEQLASGLAELLSQVATPDVHVVPAGGTDDGELGTSPERITAAIERADAGAGVLILADLGSAVLTTRAVLDEAPGPLLVDAPFVEGAVAAAVTASTGADLATVAEAAREARDVDKF
ncbi:dihydroxyacetone kinase phosphotransfer subunit [Actinoplanes octamycinicus]|uniref:phosphoenolpyruvate--glycerone phosphotransferase n=1 Tax=Actinoplanes octamycinicus TaxID=135948 RepID=A0A7W7MCF5_9ACTN|nr:dihydroxyacetone kinase phosphoryl donor subunit DhaM [Actinoplanes octamycinicus]MBB4744780.1 dihydroxyacetone kinase phosphotransfer subunit [Actinoplanes octamycinicus]GIE55363.1 PTS fructose transporter subunit IIA [Actinoplanes octamycinicus]